MKLCKYWDTAEAVANDAKGKPLRLRKWGGSNASMDDARRNARTALDDLMRRLATAGFGRDDYSYSMRDVPEELVQEISANAGVTRNGKGCLVLNTADGLFADIDVRGPGFFAKLFGATRESAERKYLAKLKEWLVRHPEAGVRIYRTRAGLRYLFTHAPCPVGPETIGWLNELGSDRLYVQLCRNQNCYRARLTPKPYRIGCGRITGHYPFSDPSQKRGFDDWLRLYDNRSRDYSVCDLIGSEGITSVHPQLAAILSVHDKMAGVNESLPLA